MPISRLFLWALLAAPLALLTYNYVSETTWLSGEVYYGFYVHDTGRYAAWLLLVVLVVTPLRLTLLGNTAIRWLAAQRRYLGVAAFAYATAHLVAYLARQEWARILEDLAGSGFWTGWIAFFIFVPLALTSNDLAVRLLRRGWKNLHRLAHLAAILVFAHWVLTAFDPLLAWCHVAALALIEAWRLTLTYRPHRAAIT